jgi:hypothetical protein
MNGCPPKSPTPSALHSKERGFKPLSLGSWQPQCLAHYVIGKAKEQTSGVELDFTHLGKARLASANLDDLRSR